MGAVRSSRKDLTKPAERRALSVEPSRGAARYWAGRMRMTVAVYITYERMYGFRSTRQELREELRVFALGPLVSLLAAINDHLRAEGGKPDPSVQNKLLPLFFDDGDIKRMSSLEPNRYPVVLHRQLLLFLMKEALVTCPDSGIILTNDFHALGSALLRANDLLAHAFPKATTSRERYLVAAAHSFSVQEANAFHSWEYKALRSYWMLNRTLPELSHKQPFFDIPRLFVEETGLNLLTFQILDFMTMTGFLKEVSKTRATSPIELPETWFSTTDFSKTDIATFLSYVSATTSDLRERMLKHQEPNDYTAFRETPLLKLDGRLVLIDFGFLCEKFESGPFWAGRRRVPEEEANVYFSFWGDLFERYVCDVLRLSSDPKLNQVIPDPRFDGGGQFTDCAVRSGRSLVMIEVKSSTLSARVKYGAELGSLDRTIRRNFVEDGNTPKALKQLINGISKLFVQRMAVPEIRPQEISTIFPVLITRDEVGSTIGIAPLLNDTFQQLLRAERFQISQSIAPLLCLSSEDMERVSSVLRDAPFCKIIEGYFRGCRANGAKHPPFRMANNSFLKQLVNQEGSDLFKDVAREFGDLVENHMKAGATTSKDA